jgi:uncharacterized protein (DUF305 family)
VTRNVKILAAVVGSLTLIAAGMLLGALLARPSTPGDDSAEAGFARDMAVHHAQAVEMGMIAHQKASAENIRVLGGDIAITQQGQIGVMNTWLKDWGLNVTSDQPRMAWMPGGERAVNGNLMPGMATREEIKKLQAATGKELDILFCQYMLRHHLGGIHMADGVLADNPTPQVREFAETIKANQTNEVEVLRTLLTSLGAAPL